MLAPRSPPRPSSPWQEAHFVAKICCPCPELVAFAFFVPARCACDRATRKLPAHKTNRVGASTYKDLRDESIVNQYPLLPDENAAAVVRVTQPRTGIIPASSALSTIAVARRKRLPFNPHGTCSVTPAMCVLSQNRAAASVFPSVRCASPPRGGEHPHSSARCKTVLESA